MNEMELEMMWAGITIERMQPEVVLIAGGVLSCRLLGANRTRKVAEAIEQVCMRRSEHIKISLPGEPPMLSVMRQGDKVLLMQNGHQHPMNDTITRMVIRRLHRAANDVEKEYKKAKGARV